MRYSEVVYKLRQAKIDNARQEAAYLVSHFCGVDMQRLILSLADDEFNSAELEEAIEKRIGGYPLQYILGEWEFFGLPFYVAEGCLIPRSDTEVLVEKAIERIPKGSVFADVCCGSGCIAISVLKARPDLSAVAVDLFDTPLSLTKKNAERNAVIDRLKIVRCDVLSEREKLKEIISGCGYLLSNPPYITKETMGELDSEVLHEPSTALFGGDDGMDFYRVLTAISDELDIESLFEIGYDQANAMIELAKNHGKDCTVYKDLSGNDRVCLITRSENKKTH